MELKNSFHPYAMVTIVFWSLAYVLTRLTLHHFSVFSLGFLRYFLASCMLIFVAVVTKMGWPHRKDAPYFLASGGIGFFFYMIAFNQGQAVVTAATGSVVIATVPVITAVLARVFYQETLLTIQWVAIAVEFIGVAVLALMDGSFSVNTGLFWLLAAALALSVYNLLQRHLTKRYAALQASTYSIFAGTMLLALFAPVSVQEVIHAPAIQYWYLVVLGIGSSGIAYVAWTMAFAKAKQTSQVSNYMFITPFGASLCGFLLAGEVPDKATVIGGGIILAGLVMFNFGGKLSKGFWLQKN